MSRNSSRLGGEQTQTADTPPTERVLDPLHFVTPTEFVELPSKGHGYPEGHPLHNKETVEIRYMTAKDEDILASKALLKKGIALERFMQNIIVDKTIRPDELLTGDRNAIIIACGSKGTFSFDLTNKKVHEPTFLEELKLEPTGTGTFVTTMPYSKFKIEFKLLRGEDENYLATMLEDKRKRKMMESALTDQG